MAISANELRIGNLVTELPSIYSSVKAPRQIDIENIWDDGVNLELSWEGEKECVSFERLEGIPLTPDWLERGGFEKTTTDLDEDGEFVTFDKGIFHLYHIEEEDGWEVGDWDLQIHFVHQLQNLYFCMTGSEIEIKQ